MLVAPTRRSVGEPVRRLCVRFAAPRFTPVRFAATGRVVALRVRRRLVVFQVPGVRATVRFARVLRLAAGLRAAVLRAVVLRATGFRAAVLRAVVLRATGFRAVVLRAVLLRATGLRAVVFRAVGFRAVLLRATGLRAVDLRATGLRAVVFRAVDFRAVLLRVVGFRAVVFRAAGLRAVVLPPVALLVRLVRARPLVEALRVRAPAVLLRVVVRRPVLLRFVGITCYSVALGPSVVRSDRAEVFVRRRTRARHPFRDDPVMGDRTTDHGYRRKFIG